MILQHEIQNSKTKIYIVSFQMALELGYLKGGYVNFWFCCSGFVLQDHCNLLYLCIITIIVFPTPLTPYSVYLCPHPQMNLTHLTRNQPVGRGTLMRKKFQGEGSTVLVLWFDFLIGENLHKLNSIGWGLFTCKHVNIELFCSHIKIPCHCHLTRQHY